MACVVLLKYHYSIASAHELQWMLRPLALLTGTLTGLQFVMDNTGAWVNARNNVAIVKSCAGLNFMIMSLFVYAQCFRPRTVGIGRTGVRLLMALGRIAACMAAAGIAALLVNTIRILAAMQLYRHEISFIGMDQAQLHRLAGVLVFFPALWLQFHVFVKLRTGMAWFMAAACYLGLMVLVPLLNGNARVNLNLYAEHVLVTGCMALGPLLVYYLYAAGSRRNPRVRAATETAKAGSYRAV